MYKRRKPEQDRDRDDHVAGTCRICGKSHYHGCAVQGCTDPGTIADSINHSCAGSARWVCRRHYRDHAA